MDRELIWGIVLIVVAFAIFAWEMVYFVQMKRGYYCEYNGHKIEFKLGFGKAFLLIDGEQVDKQRTTFRWLVVLNGQIGEDKVEFRFTTGLLKPVMKLFVNGQDCALQKNEKVKKAK